MSIKPLVEVALGAYLLAALPGCMLLALKQEHDLYKSIQKTEADGAAAQKAAMEKAQTDLYVIKDAVWFCPTAEEAKKGDCAGGQKFDKGMVVTVIGQHPNDGVWKSVVYDRAGKHDGFAPADGLNELPDTSATDAYRKKLDDDLPPAKRIRVRDLSYAALIERPKAFSGKKLVLEISNADMLDLKAEDGALTFMMLAASRVGSQMLAPVQFQMASKRWVDEFLAGKKSFSCGPSYCDKIIIVAKLTSRTVDRVDDAGNVRRLPVFEIESLADRFGLYRADKVKVARSDAGASE